MSSLAATLSQQRTSDQINMETVLMLNLNLRFIDLKPLAHLNCSIFGNGNIRDNNDRRER